MSSRTHGRFGSVVLVTAGAAFIGLAATAMLTGHDALSGTFGVLALLGFTLAALAPRMMGEVRAGLDGFRFELVREVVNAGERTGRPDDVILEAVRKALREQEPPRPSGPDDEPDIVMRGSRTGRDATIHSADYLLAEARHALSRSKSTDEAEPAGGV